MENALRGITIPLTKTAGATLLEIPDKLNLLADILDIKHARFVS